ncbi:hypothetical protein ACOSP7_004402 [Xanthoceras sorbifolium]
MKSKKPGELLNWDDIQKVKYYWNVSCEVIRLSPPSQGSFREALNDFVFNGNRPAPYMFVPFEGRPKMCIGKEYVRL